MRDSITLPQNHKMWAFKKKNKKLHVTETLFY